MKVVHGESQQWNEEQVASIRKTDGAVEDLIHVNAAFVINHARIVDNQHTTVFVVSGHARNSVGERPSILDKLRVGRVAAHDEYAEFASWCFPNHVVEESRHELSNERLIANDSTLVLHDFENR